MRKFIAATLASAALAVLPAAAQSTLDNPVTRAMLDVYEAELQANPNDAGIYFRRANEYYKFNQYLRALADVDKTIELAPKKDTDLRFQAYMLRGDIYQMLGKHPEALENFTLAQQLDPTSFMAIYQKANEEYETGDYTAAKADYTRLRAINPRSAEALTGLARVAVKENNIGLASEYMDDAVSMMSAESDIYIRRASVRHMQGNNTGAVEDLLMAISIDNNNRAFQDLINLANEDYPAVIAGLSSSISLAPQQGMLYYIRAFIAQAHDHYSGALSDYRKIIDERMYNYAGLYNSMAQCELALCRYNEALDNADRAISMDGGNNGEFFATKARIYYAQGKYEDAISALHTAADKGYASVSAHELEALIDFAEGKYDLANGIYASMIIDQPDVMRHLIYRAWVLNDGRKEPANAVNLYNRVVALTADELLEPTQGETLAEIEREGKLSALAAVQTYRGFALLFAGDKEGATAWADNLLRDYTDSDGYLHFMAACLYAQAAETDKAFRALEGALRLGYGNLYEISVADTGRVSVAPLRSDSRFNQLLARYAHLF